MTFLELPTYGGGKVLVHRAHIVQVYVNMFNEVRVVLTAGISHQLSCSLDEAIALIMEGYA